MRGAINLDLMPTIYYNDNTNLFTDEDGIEYDITDKLMPYDEVIFYKKNGGTYHVNDLEYGEEYDIEFPVLINLNRVITYYEENNLLFDEAYEVVFNIYTIITPNDLFLFKENKKNVCIKGVNGGMVDLIYCDIRGESSLSILEKINQRQRQMIVHSVLYYRYDTNIIDDRTWNRWARELVVLQKDHPDITKESAFYEEFKTWDGATGFDLANNEWGIEKAMQLIRWRDYEESERR